MTAPRLRHYTRQGCCLWGLTLLVLFNSVTLRAEDLQLQRLDAIDARLVKLASALDESTVTAKPATLRQLLRTARSASLDLGKEGEAAELRSRLLTDLQQIKRLLRARQADQSAAPSLISLSRRKLEQLRRLIRNQRSAANQKAQLSWLTRIIQSTHADQHVKPIVSALALTIGMLATGGVWRVWRKRYHPSETQNVLDSLPDAVALFNPKGQLTASNKKLLKLLPLELPPEALENCSGSELFAQLSPNNIAIERARNRARDALDELDGTLSFEIPGYGRKCLLIKERMTAAGGTAVTVYSNSPGQNPRRSDPLTALPNRASLVHELAQRCSRAKNEIALLIVDLRSFRQINDTYGRPVGDELLKQTAICLQHCMPPEALIARTAGDEFAVLIEFDGSRNLIEKRVEKFLTTLGSGLKVNTMSVPARASVGIAFAPEHGNTVSSLLTCADSACAHAKQVSNNALVVFNSVQQQEAKRRHQLEVGLQQAVEKNEMSLQYQPQIDIKSKTTCGMEALLRWRSKEFGRVSPDEFIDIAEQTGIINQLGMWVLRQAISDYQRLARYGMSPATLSVNLSRKQFDNGRIVHDVAQVIEETGFDPHKLCLEITETALFRDSTALHEILHDLTGLGAKLAIDDFGVGYSSLLELRDFPIAEVKIDRAFVTNIASNANSQDIVAAVVSIAASIGAEVVAEGIENQQQFDMVAALGCDRAQGYYLCEPMPATTFPDLVLSS